MQARLLAALTAGVLGAALPGCGDDGAAPLGDAGGADAGSMEADGGGMDAGIRPDASGLDAGAERDAGSDGGTEPDGGPGDGGAPDAAPLAAFGEPCASDAACASGLCLHGSCTLACSAPTDCPADH